MKLLKWITCIIVSGLTTASFAAVQVPTGWYLEANGGATNSSNTNYGTGSSSSTSGAGYNINAGYKFIPFFGAEVGYTKYAKATIDNAAGIQVGQDTHYSYDIAGKGILPISATGFELFAKLGVSRINSHVTVSNSALAAPMGLGNGNHSSTNVYYGVGADYSITPQLPINIQWAQAQGNNTTGSLSLLSAGIAYIFG